MDSPLFCFFLSASVLSVCPVVLTLTVLSQLWGLDWFCSGTGKEITPCLVVMFFSIAALLVPGAIKAVLFCHCLERKWLQYKLFLLPCFQDKTGYWILSNWLCCGREIKLKLSSQNFCWAIRATLERLEMGSGPSYRPQRRAAQISSMVSCGHQNQSISHHLQLLHWCFWGHFWIIISLATKRE